jgi:hypothetical protein
VDFQNSPFVATNECRKVQIQASNQHAVVREASEHAKRSPQVPASRESSACIDCFGRSQSFGTILEQIIGLSCESSNRPFIPRSSLRPLSRRVAHHSELPLFRALRQFPPIDAPPTDMVLSGRKTTSMPPPRRRLAGRGRNSSGQHHTVRESVERSENRRRDRGFGPSHRDSANRTLNAELAAIGG